MRIPASTSRLFDYGRNAGSNIHSISWGTQYNSYESAERSLDMYAADNPEWLAVIASGNSGSDPHTVGSPATAKNGLTGKKFHTHCTSFHPEYSITHMACSLQLVQVKTRHHTQPME